MYQFVIFSATPLANGLTCTPPRPADLPPSIRRTAFQFSRCSVGLDESREEAECDELLREGRDVETARGAVDVHGEDGAPILAVAQPDEPAVGESGREASELDLGWERVRGE